MVNVLSIPIYDQQLDAAVAEVLALCQASAPRSNRLVSATSVHGVVEAQSNPTLAQVLHQFYLNLPDGMPLVWVGRLKGASKMLRISGPPFFAAFMQRSAALPIRHFFCGGKSGVAEELRKAVADKFGNPQVVGSYSPPFREMSDAELQDLAVTIDASGADVVWVGISTPKQEILAHRLARYTHVHCLITVGAAFDFHTGRVQKAPRWMSGTGLEWLYRLTREPARLLPRYARIIPLFLYYNLRELVMGPRTLTT